MSVRAPSLSFDRDTGQVPEEKKAKVKDLFILPIPVPAIAKPYVMDACFDVAANGDSRLLTWTKSRDTLYNKKIEESLKRYTFTPATINGVAVRDTACVRAKAG
jgi:hypothetical protein